MKADSTLKFLLFLTLMFAVGCISRLASKGNDPGFEPVRHGNWRALGPSGMPNLVSKANTYGVGQANRIAFDPNYDGVKNRTVYVCSSFGGLWRSEDDGLKWYNVNTDFLPSTSVADVCINPFDSKMIFIGTGYADGGILDTRGPNWSQINPIPTSGIFRSKDWGQTWENISDGFIQDFDFSGMPRKMVINPLNPDQVFIASTNGIYRSDNAASDLVRWKNVFAGLLPGEQDFRSVVIKPDDANVIYAGSKDIFRSKDSGISWERLTGGSFGLDLRSIADTFAVDRINLAVTPANPERLYAYIIGDKIVNEKRFKGAYIALFEQEKWRIIDARWSAGLTYFAVQWIALDVSPVDADMIYYGNSRVIGTEKLDSIPFDLRSSYCGNGFHADVHDLVFQPNVENPKLFCGNHGGISVKSFPNPNQGGWEYRNEGYNTAIIWSFDDSPSDENVAVIATQDNGTLIYFDTLGHKWHFIGGGDGYTSRIDDSNPHAVYFSNDDRALNFFNLKTFAQNNQTGKIPFDPYNNKDLAMTVKTFPVVSHPVSGQPWFGFSEIFTKEITQPEFVTPREEVWTRQSDLHLSEPAAWKRQITEISICKSDPDVIYVVTAGQQNPPHMEWQLKSGLYKSENGGIKGTDQTGLHFEPVDYPGKDFDDDTLAIITGVLVHPLNPDHIWLTYTGIPREYRIWESKDGGKTWENADPEGVFAVNPVNAIAYLEGSDDRLYLGADRGLYTKTRTTDWQKVDDFPNVRITEVNINKQFDRIRVATFGRGLWDGPVSQ
ncbi:MAG: hypothetical protein IH598_11050 [Bacteroidales bacterium]|nr:hypothetical protein [Bacteroidales bacterium]